MIIKFYFYFTDDLTEFKEIIYKDELVILLNHKIIMELIFQEYLYGDVICSILSE